MFLVMGLIFILAAVLAILHDINLAAAVPDQLVMMKQGKIAYLGKSQDTLSPDSLRDVFEVSMERAQSPHHPVLFFPETD